MSRLEESRVRQERASKVLINVKAGVEHLADKLQHLKAVSTVRLALVFKLSLWRALSRRTFSTHLMS